MAKRVYIETTIPGYLAAWPSRDIIQAARQQLTHDWWNIERLNYDLCVSETVLDEAAAGDAVAAERRLALIEDLPLRAAHDSIHIAVAAVHGIDLLLTWNCKHIANATMRFKFERTCRLGGFAPPIICTPEELSED